jgi:hypothetical protein
MGLGLALPLVVPVVFGLAACGSPPRQTTQVIVQPAPAAVMPTAPNPPPPAMSELVPSPPVSSTPAAWQPGHWRYTGIAGSPWNWVGGQYVAFAAGAVAWVPGRWQQQGDGWVWREGHWAA